MTTKSEVLRIPRSVRLQAFGLWAMAGAWSAKELSDGHIPQHMLEELAGVPSDAQWLVDVGIWTVVDDGWQFNEWAPVQPLRERVLEDREKNAQRQKSFRTKHVASNGVTDSVTSFVTDAGSPAVADAATHAVSAAVSADAPSLPSPTLPNPSTKYLVQDEPALPTQLDIEFAEWWKIYPRKQAKAPALRVFKKVRKTVPLETLMDGVRKYALLQAGGDKSLVKLPAGWLNDARWNDEDEVPSSAVSSGKASQIADVLALGRNLHAAQSPELRARTTTGLPLSGFCDLHDGYPLPCDRCQRDAEIPEGNQF